MKKLILVTVVFLSGCAKFRFQQGSFVVIPSVLLEVQSPSAGTVLDPGTTFTMTGVCDPLGGLVTIVGTSMAEASVSGACDPILGVFSINATSVGNGELLDIQATQTDGGGTVLNSDVTNIMIHCAGVPMRTCRVSGSGNPSDPYMVGNISCLQEMRSGLSCNYALNNNIDASATSGWNAGRGWEPVPVTSNVSIRFTGVLDGRNRSISNLYVTPRNGNGAGLFSRIHDEGDGLIDDQVYNLTLVNPTADSFDVTMNYPNGFGILAGNTNTVGIRNVDIVGGSIDLESNTTLNSIGLLTGYAQNSNFSDSQVAGTIAFNGLLDNDTKYEMVGGFTGFLENSQVIDSGANMTYATAPGNLYYFYRMGGAFGRIRTSTVSRFTTTSNLTLEYFGTTPFSGLDQVGGFSGIIDHGSTVTDICVNNNLNFYSANAPVVEVGGFVGHLSYATSNETLRRISLRGDLNIDANGNNVSDVAGYTGMDMGPSVHSDIMMDQNIEILNGVSPLAWVGYGGLVNSNSGSSSFTNIVGISAHSISPGINDPGGMFYAINSSPITSVFYANDVSLGGLPDEGTMGSPGLVTTSNLAGLGAMASAGYTGFDFATVWQRDTITNIPELRFCP